MYFFDVNDVESRHEYICDHYNRLKKIDPNNDLLKFATTTYSAVYWNKVHSEEFYNRFSQPQHVSNFNATLDLNYGMAIYDEIVRLRERKSYMIHLSVVDKLDSFTEKSELSPTSIKQFLDDVSKN